MAFELPSIIQRKAGARERGLQHRSSLANGSGSPQASAGLESRRPSPNRVHLASDMAPALERTGAGSGRPQTRNTKKNGERLPQKWIANPPTT
jgi:hypothetical protein